MKAIVQVDQGESKGIFSSSVTYTVFIQLVLDDDEQAVIRDFAPYQPDPVEHVQLDDYDRDNWKARLGKEGILKFTQGIRSSFASIQQAGKFEDAVLQAFSEYAGQISAARGRASLLGARREIEIET